MSLPNFGRRRVRKAGLAIRKVGSGLDEHLGFAPVALNVGEEVFLVVKGVVVDVHHPAENRKDPASDDLIRVHVADAIEVAMVEAAEAEPLLKAADDRLAEYRLQASLAEEAASGIMRLPVDD